MSTKIRQILQYRTSPNISQSYLKNWRKGNPPRKGSSLAMDKGNLLDALVTMPKSFKSLYHVSTIQEKPTKGTKLDLAIHYMLAYGGNLLGEPEYNEMKWMSSSKCINLFEEATEEFYSKMDTRKKFEKYFVPLTRYWEDLIEASGKEVLSQDELDEAKIAASSIKSFCKHILKRETATVHMQYPVYATLEGVKCKGLLDIFVVDEDGLEIWDLKRTDYSHRLIDTPAKTADWPFQLGFYKALVEKKLGMKVKKLGWLVYSSIDQSTQIYEASTKDLYVAKFGYQNPTPHKSGTKTFNRTFQKEGWLQLLHEYKEYGDTRFWLKDEHHLKKSFYGYV